MNDKLYEEVRRSNLAKQEAASKRDIEHAERDPEGYSKMRKEQHEAWIKEHQQPYWKQD